MRALRLILACLAIGAAVSIAVAWACVMSASPLEFDAQLTAALREREDDRRARGPEAGEPSWINLAFRGRGVQALYLQDDDDRRTLLTDQTFVVRAGWPLCCFEGWREKINGEMRHSAAVPLDRMLTLSQRYRPSWITASMLPYLPMWPEFALSAAAYGLAAGGLWLVLALARRTWRRCRHRCTRCGYDLRGVEHKRCPECGALMRD